MRLLLAGLPLLISLPALADQPVSIVGTWVPVEHASARTGSSPYYGATTRPTLTTSMAAAWSYTFDSQDGRVFAGTASGPKGGSEAVVGVFRHDGRRFVISTDSGSGDGEVEDDGLEICWTDSVANYVAASCTLYERK